MTLRQQAVELLDGLSEDNLRIVIEVIRQMEGEEDLDRLPGPPHLDMSRWTREQFDAEMQKGYDAILAGRTCPAEEVAAEFHREFGI